MINIEKIKLNVGGSEHVTNSYIIFDENKNSILIDPADESDILLNKIKSENYDIKYIIVTHGHADHIGAIEKIVEYTNATIIVHEEDFLSLLGMEPSYASELNVRDWNLDGANIIKVKDTDKFQVGEINFEIIHTPGHTSGSICIFEEKLNILVTGDTLFSDCYGRCDLHSANFEDMVKSLKKLFDRFSDIIIYPGHGEVSNIKQSKKYVKMLLALKGIKL